MYYEYIQKGRVFRKKLKLEWHEKLGIGLVSFAVGYVIIRLLIG